MPSPLKLSLLLVALVWAIPAIAQTQPAGVEVDPRIPSLTYEEWKHANAPTLIYEYRAPFGGRIFGYDDYYPWPRGFYGLWDHDEPLEVRTRRVGAFYAERPAGYWNYRHPQYFAFFDPTDLPVPGQIVETAGQAYVSYQQRFIAEAAAGGDIIVPFEGRRVEGGPKYPMVAVFAAGTPGDQVDRLLFYLLGQRGQPFWLDLLERTEVVAAYRATRGLTTEARDLIWGNRPPVIDHPHPPPTYEEWVYGVFQLRGWILWPHDSPLAERQALTAEWWAENRNPPWAWSGPATFPFWTQHIAMILLGDGDEDDAYQARWISEAIAAGDTVIPFPPVWRTSGDAPLGNGREIAFLVFDAGAPPEIIEPMARSYLADRGLTEEEIDGVIAAFVSERGN